MTITQWSATVGGNNVPNIQSVSIRQGQRKITDQFQSASLTVSGRLPGSLPTINLGDVISVTQTFNSLGRTYSFRVSDYSVEYGLNSAYDSYTIYGEDAFAVLGRAEIDISWSSGTLAKDNAEDVCDLVGVTFSVGTSLPSTTTCNAQTITNGNALDVLNVLANTEGARLSATATFIQWLPRNWQSVMPTVHASDDGTGTNPVKYDSLSFASLADNLADQVTVNIRGGSAVTVGSGPYAFSLDSYSVSSNEGQDVAAFELASLDVDSPVPTQISYILNQQTNNGWQDWDNYKKAVIKFRNTTYNVFVIGVTYSANVSETRVTWDLVSSEFYRFLVLDDAVLGKLDENKLGW